MTSAILLTSTEAAKRLRVSERLLRDMRQRGLIRYVRLSARKVAYRPEDCDQYIEANLRCDIIASQPRWTGKVGRDARSSGSVIPFSQRKG